MRRVGRLLYLWMLVLRRTLVPLMAPIHLHVHPLADSVMHFEWCSALRLGKVAKGLPGRHAASTAAVAAPRRVESPAPSPALIVLVLLVIIISLHRPRGALCILRRLVRPACLLLLKTVHLVSRRVLSEHRLGILVALCVLGLGGRVLRELLCLLHRSRLLVRRLRLVLGRRVRCVARRWCCYWLRRGVMPLRVGLALMRRLLERAAIVCGTVGGSDLLLWMFGASGGRRVAVVIADRGCIRGSRHCMMRGVGCKVGGGAVGGRSGLVRVFVNVGARMVGRHRLLFRAILEVVGSVFHLFVLVVGLAASLELTAVSLEILCRLLTARFVRPGLVLRRRWVVGRPAVLCVAHTVLVWLHLNRYGTRRFRVGRNCCVLVVIRPALVVFVKAIGALRPLGMVNLRLGRRRRVGLRGRTGVAGELLRLVVLLW